MPFMLIVIGLVLVITSIQNTYSALGQQLQKDLVGPQGFIVWALALIAVGALGYVNGWEKFSRWFLALILIAIVLAQSKRAGGAGLFGNALTQIKNPKVPQANSTNQPATTQAPLNAPGNVLGVPSQTPPGGWFDWMTALPTFKFTNPFATQ